MSMYDPQHPDEDPTRRLPAADEAANWEATPPVVAVEPVAADVEERFPVGRFAIGIGGLVLILVLAFGSYFILPGMKRSPTTVVGTASGSSAPDPAVDTTVTSPVEPDASATGGVSDPAGPGGTGVVADPGATEGTGGSDPAAGSGGSPPAQPAPAAGGQQVDAYDVKVGDCLANPGNNPTVQTLTRLDCAQPHYTEAYASFDLTGSDFPGEDQVKANAVAGCDNQFTTFVGIPRTSSSLDVSFMTPTADTWAGGDRAVTCMVFQKGGADVVGSLRGSKR